MRKFRNLWENIYVLKKVQKNRGVKSKKAKFIDKGWLRAYNKAVNNGKGMLIHRILSYSLKYSDK